MHWSPYYLLYYTMIMYARHKPGWYHVIAWACVCEQWTKACLYLISHTTGPISQIFFMWVFMTVSSVIHSFWKKTFFLPRQMWQAWPKAICFQVIPFLWMWYLKNVWTKFHRLGINDHLNTWWADQISVVKSHCNCIRHMFGHNPRICQHYCVSEAVWLPEQE